MKIKSWELKLTWEDGTVNDVTNYVSVYTINSIEQFIDYWEEKYSDDDSNDAEDEAEAQRIDDASWRP